jgi:hypothetical protein
VDNPWRSLPLQPPFVLEPDRQSINAFNLHSKPNVKIHLEALPEPYLGNPLAPVVLLSLNPGFGDETLPFHHENAYFKESHRQNLFHIPTDFPFYLLDPGNKASPGYQWWWKHMRALIETCGQIQVANRVLCVEYFPYASQHFGFKNLLPSQTYGFYLVQQAMKRGAVILVMRGERFWLTAIPSLKEYTQFFRLNNVQSVYVTENNCPAGYASIVEGIRSGN